MKQLDTLSIIFNILYIYYKRAHVHGRVFFVLLFFLYFYMSIELLNYLNYCIFDRR